jgi:hypothetical protein
MSNDDATEFQWVTAANETESLLDLDTLLVQMHLAGLFGRKIDDPIEYTISTGKYCRCEIRPAPTNWDWVMPVVIVTVLLLVILLVIWLALYHLRTIKHAPSPQPVVPTVVGPKAGVASVLGNSRLDTTNFLTMARRHTTVRSLATSDPPSLTNKYKLWKIV